MTRSIVLPTVYLHGRVIGKPQHLNIYNGFSHEFCILFRIPAINEHIFCCVAVPSRWCDKPQPWCATHPRLEHLYRTSSKQWWYEPSLVVKPMFPVAITPRRFMWVFHIQSVLVNVCVSDCYNYFPTDNGFLRPIPIYLVILKSDIPISADILKKYRKKYRNA